MSNNARQEAFRKRHPGYNKKYRSPTNRQMRRLAEGQAMAAAMASGELTPAVIADPRALVSSQPSIELSIGAMAA